MKKLLGRQMLNIFVVVQTGASRFDIERFQIRVGLRPANADGHFLPGRDRFGVALQRRKFNDTLLRGRDVFFLGFTKPERSQAKCVGAKYNFVPLARNDGGGSLGEHTESAAAEKVKILQGGREFLKLAPNRRE